MKRIIIKKNDAPLIRRIDILSIEDAKSEMELIGVHPDGIRVMAGKSFIRPIKIYSLSPYQANILKQEMLSIGADAANSAGCINCSCDKSDVLLLGTPAHYIRLVDKLKLQPPSFHTIAEKILEYSESAYLKVKSTWKFADRSIQLGDSTKIMGIVNVTPDSFSDGGDFLDPERAVEHALKLENEGADILDIGGESSRPGSAPVSVEEEKRRVLPVIEKLRIKTDIPISIDTWKAEVAKSAIELGADIVNDITALRGDPAMASLCAEKKVGVVLMHKKGTPETMQDKPFYDNVLQEIASFLEEAGNNARNAGVNPESIVYDPGIGFGKTLQHNLVIIHGIPSLLNLLERPILMGVSRKRFIGTITDSPVEDRLAGTISAVVTCALKGSAIMRVHDVAECAAALKISNAILHL
jgi:dihydropteroate synthase